MRDCCQGWRKSTLASVLGGQQTLASVFRGKQPRRENLYTLELLEVRRQLDYGRSEDLDAASPIPSPALHAPISSVCSALPHASAASADGSAASAASSSASVGDSLGMSAGVVAAEGEAGPLIARVLAWHCISGTPQSTQSAQSRPC